MLLEGRVLLSTSQAPKTRAIPRVDDPSAELGFLGFVNRHVPMGARRFRALWPLLI